MFGLGCLLVALTLASGFVQIVLAIAAMGAFLYSLHSIFIAAAMSVSGEGTQATIVSLIYGASFIGTVSPIIAGLFADSFGTRSVFLYAALLVFAGTLIFALLKLPTAKALASG
jgi:MFS family permease